MKIPTLVTFEFTIGYCNGSMGLKILLNNIVILNQKKFTSDYFKFSVSVDWPCQLILEVSNKDNECDTQLDAAQNIIADKYIKLEKLLIDRLPASLNNINLKTGNTIITSNYWGFNGQIQIDLTGENSFLWHLKQKSSELLGESYVVDYKNEKYELDKNGRLQSDTHKAAKMSYPIYPIGIEK